MGSKTQYILFGLIGLIVLYALSKLRNPEVQQVPEFIGSQPAGTSDSVALRESSRLGAFQALAQLGASQIAATTNKDQTAAQLEATRIASGVQMNEQSTAERIQGIISSSAERIQELLTGAQERVASQTITADVTKTQSALDFQAQAYAADLSNRAATAKLQLEAVQKAAYDFRNQSLERQGSVFNALAQTWGAGQPYSYQNSFGGARGPSVLQQLFPGGIGGIVSGFLGI